MVFSSGQGTRSHGALHVAKWYLQLSLPPLPRVNTGSSPLALSVTGAGWWTVAGLPWLPPPLEMDSLQTACVQKCSYHYAMSLYWKRLKCQLVLRASCPNWVRSGIDSGKCACGESWSAEHIFKWDMVNMNVQTFGSYGGPGACFPRKFWNLGPSIGWKCTRNFANLMFSGSKSMTLAWLSKI